MKPMNKWGSQEIQEFFEHPEKLAADGDLAITHPEIRHAALKLIESRCTCDFKDPLKYCLYHDQKAKTLIHEMRTDREYEPSIQFGDL